MIKRFPLRQLAVAVFALLVAPGMALGDWYVPGGWSTGPYWDPTSNLMTDMGGGIHQITFTGQDVNARYEFKVLDVSGDWSSYPNEPDSSNVWGYTDSNGVITITMDENSLGNGFLRDANRILVTGDPTSWNVVGDFMDEAGGIGDWDNGDALFTMSDDGGGFFGYSAIVNAAGTYNGRVVNTGTWDGFGTQGRSVHSWNWELIANNPGDTLNFALDTNTGTIFAGVTSGVPEPSGMALLALAGAGLMIQSRRRT